MRGDMNRGDEKCGNLQGDDDHRCYRHLARFVILGYGLRAPSGRGATPAESGTIRNVCHRIAQRMVPISDISQRWLHYKRFQIRVCAQHILAPR